LTASARQHQRQPRGAPRDLDAPRYGTACSSQPRPVTVIAREDAESFELRPTEEEELLRASAEAERGNLVDGGEALATLGRT